jgi:hypothetical protein
LLTGISPSSGAVGATVNLQGSALVGISGSGFRTYTVLPSITFYNGVAATATSAQTVTQCVEESVTTTVPTGATTGAVTETIQGNTSNAVSFTVP